MYLISTRVGKEINKGLICIWQYFLFLSFSRVLSFTHFNATVSLGINQNQGPRTHLTDFGNIKRFTILTISTFLTESSKYCSRKVGVDSNTITSPKVFWRFVAHTERSPWYLIPWPWKLGLRGWRSFRSPWPLT